MRIGIIAGARSGGMALGEWMALELGIPFYHEPHTFKTEIVSKDKWIQKWLVGEWWDMVGKGIQPKEMDKCIRLWREDSREVAISSIRANETGEWHKGYELNDEWIKERENDILIQTQRAKGDVEWLKSFEGPKLNITYEGIYESGKDIKRLTDYLGIQSPKYLQLLDSSNRLRRVKGGKQKQWI
jgi:hypothetical protein